MIKSYLCSLGLLVLLSIQVSAQESEIRHDGLLLPNLTAIQMNAIVSPSDGHTIFNSDTNSIWFYNGTNWLDSRIDPITSAPFESSGSTVRQTGGYANSDFIFGRDAIPDNNLISDKFFFFDKQSGALRGGQLFSSDAWKQSSLGSSSFAWGNNAEAIGDFSSVSIGHRNEASGNYGSVALGIYSNANGDYGSVAIGSHNSAFGEFGSTSIGYNNSTRGNNGAVAIGHGLRSYGDSGTAVGTYNDPIVSQGEPLSSDSPIFIVGNGDATIRSNALVIYKNGETHVEEDLIVKKRAQVDGVLQANDNLMVFKDAILNQNAQVSGNMSVSGSVDIFSNLEVTNDVLFKNNFEVREDMNLEGRLVVEDNVTFNSKLDVIGDSSITGKLTVVDNAIFEELIFINEGIKFKPTVAPGVCDFITEGVVYYNESLKKLKFCDGSNWVNLN